MPSLYSIIDLSSSKLFKKFPTIQTIIPTIVISILITTVLLFSTTSIYAEEIENEADNGMSELINSGKELLKQFIYEIDGTKSNTTYIEEKDLHPDTQKYLNHARETLKINGEQIQKNLEQNENDGEKIKEEPEMTYAEKKAKEDPEYAKLLQHNKELYEKEHPGWQNKQEPNNELDAIYSDKEYKKEIKPHEYGKTIIPFLGAWEESKLQDGLSWCVSDDVSFTLEHNFINAFKVWGQKIHKLDDRFEFQKKKTCNNVDVEVVYRDEDDDEFDAQTITTHNENNEITHAQVILYTNTYYQKEGYKYNIKYDNDGGIDEDGDKGKTDGKFYKWYYNVMKHEVGHVLGLDHTSNPNYLMNEYNDYERNFPLSGCEAAAAIKKNFIDRGLNEVICELS